MRAKFTKKIGVILLAIWLIATGLISLVPQLRNLSSVDLLSLALAILALAAGVLLLIDW